MHCLEFSCEQAEERDTGWHLPAPRAGRWAGGGGGAGGRQQDREQPRRSRCHVGVPGFVAAAVCPEDTTPAIQAAAAPALMKHSDDFFLLKFTLNFYNFCP